jgi:hypothetical protein
MMKNQQDLWQLTSIKLLSDIYSDFRSESKIQSITLQKLVNRSMWLYNNDSSFRDQIKDTKTLKENYKNGY